MVDYRLTGDSKTDGAGSPIFLADDTACCNGLVISNPPLIMAGWKRPQILLKLHLACVTPIRFFPIGIIETVAEVHNAARNTPGAMGEIPRQGHRSVIFACHSNRFDLAAGLAARLTDNSYK